MFNVKTSRQQSNTPSSYLVESINTPSGKYINQQSSGFDPNFVNMSKLNELFSDKEKSSALRRDYNNDIADQNSGNKMDNLISDISAMTKDIDSKIEN